MTKVKKIMKYVFAFLFIVVVVTVVKLPVFNSGKIEILKKKEVVELLNSLNAMKMDYAIKLLESDGVQGAGFKEFDLNAYGLESVDYIKLDDSEGSEKFERRIELATNKLIIIFGAGFDGDVEKDIELVAEQAAGGRLNWSCTVGSLSNKYRPRSCYK